MPFVQWISGEVCGARCRAVQPPLPEHLRLGALERERSAGERERDGHKREALEG
jgi:hypothetical protein